MQRLNICKSAVANNCQITINTITHDPDCRLPLSFSLLHSSWTLSGKTNGGIRDLWRGNGSQVEECDWWGSPARLGEEANPNPSHSLFKAANVSFEEIILFGHLIALGNYGPLQGVVWYYQDRLPAREMESFFFFFSPLHC